ncbi:MAG: ABC transporter substrate-binding protein [Chloroflexota bacterium]|nr:ABC transporter substrate-binding protein [Chloroflexota bacterium]
MGRLTAWSIPFLAGIILLLGLAVACGPASTPTPTPAPTPTRALVATPTPVPAATPTPTSAAPKIGRQLIGKLEGPEVITDTAKWPKKFNEAPQLAELVKAGKLPPVEKRLPEEPMVLKPVHQIGKYGGTWRRGFTGPADSENANRIVASDKLMMGDYTGLKAAPSLAKAWKASDDGMSFTLYLRKGAKWSDGDPFTADDIMFWYEDMVMNKELVPIPPNELNMSGQFVKIEKVDDYTVVYKFPSPNYLWEEIMAIDTQTASGHAMGGSVYGGFVGGYAPSHYLKQFHPKYTPKEELDKKVQEAKFDNWVSLMKFKNNWALNTEVPVMTAWKSTSPINTPTWVLERNPYYWAVDTEGNQLPYIDKIVLTLAENLEVLNLRAIAGEYDIQERHLTLPKLPVFLENQEKGNYKLHLDPCDCGSDAGLYVNQTYDADLEIAKWLTNVDFRRALSLGIDRDQLNEVFWVGVGTPGSAVVAESNPFNPGPEYRKLWSVYDPKKSNEMLDKLGLDKKDGEGYRLRTDGKGRLVITVEGYGAQFLDLPQMGQMVKEHWKTIGIFGDVKEVERSLLNTRTTANQVQIQLTWGNTGTENPFTRGFLIPEGGLSAYGPEYGKWFASAGTSGRQPTSPEMLRVMELTRSGPGLTPAKQVEAAKEMWRIAIDQQWMINLVGLGPAVIGVRIVKNDMGNVPDRNSIYRAARVPGGGRPETFFFKR